MWNAARAQTSQAPMIGRAEEVIGSPSQVRYWHKADIPTEPLNVRFWGKADMALMRVHVC